MPAKIPLPADADLAPDIREALSLLNIFRMLANAPASFKPLVDLAASILLQSEFDARKREIAVLRVAHVTRSGYEWTQHVALAKRAGVSEEEINKIAVSGPVTGFDEEGNLLCRVADEISRDVRLSDAALDAVVARYGVRQATELILCCSYFNMLSRFIESTRVELESPLVL